MSVDLGSAWVCPACGAETDPYSNICEHCRHIHMGRLRAAPPEEEGRGEPLEVREIQDEEPPDPSSPGGSAGAKKVLFSYLCPNPNCRIRNLVYDERHNACFNCGQRMFLSPEEREARWYEEAGRSRRNSGGTGVWLGLGGCLFFFLGVPFIVGGIVDMRRGRREWDRGKEMNRAAGRGPLARSRWAWVEPGRSVPVYKGPDRDVKPKNYDFSDARWLKPFSRLYYAAWASVVIIYLIAHS